MEIPERDNVASVEVDGQMWSTRPQDGQAGWWCSVDGVTHWLSVAAFEDTLDSASEVTFFSPMGRVIEHG